MVTRPFVRRPLARSHRDTFVAMLAVLAHVAAVFGYAIFKRHDLVRPMITGRKTAPHDADAGPV